MQLLVSFFLTLATSLSLFLFRFSYVYPLYTCFCLFIVSSLDFLQRPDIPVRLVPGILRLISTASLCIEFRTIASKLPCTGATSSSWKIWNVFIDTYVNTVLLKSLKKLSIFLTFCDNIPIPRRKWLKYANLKMSTKPSKFFSSIEVNYSSTANN